MLMSDRLKTGLKTYDFKVVYVAKPSPNIISIDFWVHRYQGFYIDTYIVVYIFIKIKQRSNLDDRKKQIHVCRIRCNLYIVRNRVVVPKY